MFDYTMPRRPCGMRAVVLDVIAPGPPPWSDTGERRWQRDLDYLPSEDLIHERDRIRLRLQLTPTREYQDWPALWFVERLQRIEELLRADRTAAAWSRGRR